MNAANKPRIVHPSLLAGAALIKVAAGQTLPDSPENAVPSLEKINKGLKSYTNADARWWSYNPTQRTFEIVVGDPTRNGKIVLCLAGCDHITGPVEWKNQRLEAKWIRDIQGNWHLSIADEVAGFQAVGDELRSFPLITTKTQAFPQKGFQ